MNELENLRDIHSPPPISFWPPAPGWWILATLVFLSVVSAWLFYRWQKKRALRKMALIELNQLQQSLSKGQDLSTFSAQISTLLRRLALTQFNRNEVAGLTGRAWLEFLDRTGQTKNFTQGVGKTVITAPYQTTSDIDAQELVSIVKDWIHLNT
ncbi:MAG TPA: DUF4381 domain-containing protein [Gammaproteobacteria bacterium]|nr:DUF4381 domain-containing protein [Gammaproteobacteria bacterium]